MGLRIIYGKSGSGKSEYCFKEIAKLIKKEKKIYIITPEQFSFTAEKKLMNAIDKKAVINAVFPTERPPTIGIQIGTASLLDNGVPQCGQIASRFFLPLKNVVGSFSPQLHLLFKMP